MSTVHHRLGHPALVGDERHGEHDGGGEQAEHAGRAPAPGVALGDAEQQRGERQR
jgi:hypothetical protein